MDDGGMAFTGDVKPVVHFEPLPAKLKDTVREGGELQALVYEADGGADVEVPLSEVFDRMQEGELAAPYKVLSNLPATETDSCLPVDSDDGAFDIRKPGGRLPSVCLFPEAIRRKDTVVREIRFSTGLVLKVPEAVALQDAGALILPELQLIHPKNANPYFRSPADDSTENNFENLPKFDDTRR